ncbi:MAG: peptide ABC transporter substrate-binding protein [Thermomicrobiales bacterium]
MTNIKAKLRDQRVDRRTLLGGAAASGLGMFGGAMLQPGGVLASPSSGMSRTVRSMQDLPEGAAPVDQQILLLPDDAAVARVLDFYMSVYTRPSDSASDVFSEPLVRLDKNFQLMPAAAESWSGSEDGKTWTFKIREGMMWSDGNPVTAADWIASFQNAVTPDFAWDFTWYFQGVLTNWTQAVNGEVAPDQIGVAQGANEYELVFTTEAAAPYLPAMLLYSNPISAAGLSAHGPLYNTDPATAISAGPFILTEWVPDQQIVYSRNTAYTGTLPTMLEKIVIKLTSKDNYFTMYQANEIDFLRHPAPAAIEIMMADEATAAEVHSTPGDFPTYYLFFDQSQAPFNDLRVRQAWSHAIDRDALKEAVLGPAGIPAYSWLAPGFPASQTQEIKDVQGFDPELAKSLLTEAGFPDGEGFPSLQLQLRAPTPLEKSVAAAIAAMLKEHLNVNVELLERDSQGFTADMNAKPTLIQLGFVRYGMDFLDPINMLSVWFSGGRHDSWKNEEFESQAKAAGEFLGDPAERIAMFQAAERIMVEDVAGVFVYHGTEVQLIKPWMTGPFKDPDDNGNTGMHWPNFATMSTVPGEVYIGADAPSR